MGAIRHAIEICLHKVQIVVRDAMGNCCAHRGRRGSSRPRETELEENAYRSMGDNGVEGLAGVCGKMGSEGAPPMALPSLIGCAVYGTTFALTVALLVLTVMYAREGDSGSWRLWLCVSLLLTLIITWVVEVYALFPSSDIPDLLASLGVPGGLQRLLQRSLQPGQTWGLFSPARF